MKYIIVGGVASGAAFSCRLRRLDENAEIIIYEKTNFVSYANCGLPYYVGDVIKSSNNLTLQTPKSLKERFNIDVFTSHEVIDIDKDNKIITVKNLLNNEVFTDSYDKLILCLGSKAIEITERKDNIFILKTVEDSKRLKEYIDKNNVKTASVIGGGFIGIEILENLKERNIDVSLIEASNQVLTNFDYEMVSFIHKELLDNNVNLYLNKRVEKIESNNKECTIYFNNETIISDIVIEAIGVKPNTDFLIDKLELNLNKTIKVDSNFKSINDIYALGDDVNVISEIDNLETYIPLANLASKEGRDLASNFILKDKMNIKALHSSIVKVFNLNAGTVGLNEKTLIKKNIPYKKIYLSPSSHATYYPNSSILNMKVMYSPIDLNILGVEIVGKDGVDKRLDVLSMAIKYKVKATTLKDIDFVYAPPFSSSKDPINMIGYMIENLENNLVYQYYLEDIEELIDNNSFFLDVKTPYEYSKGSIKGSINIPLDELRERINELPKDKTIYLICESAIRSYIGSRILLQKGYKCKHLSGGYRLIRIFKESNQDYKTYLSTLNINN